MADLSEFDAMRMCCACMERVTDAKARERVASYLWERFKVPETEPTAGPDAIGFKIETEEIEGTWVE
jgi:hypothetical protein